MLTVLQLWAAVDQLAIAQHPIHADYSPETPLSLLEPLLLRSSLSLRGLVKRRDYLGARHERASMGSVFSDEMTPTSFAIRFFNASRQLQPLKKKIEKTAEAEHNKLQELRAATEQHASLVRQAEALEHTETTSRWHDWT
ncbi:hypothetical protein DXG03_005848, partial [Asterophora parasitica]